jgi:predicted RNA binding protein YcfA (HicA-like mRNA interferase family)
LNGFGFYQKHQHGSHIILRRDDPFSQVVVPDHPAAILLVDRLAASTLRETGYSDGTENDCGVYGE